MIMLVINIQRGQFTNVCAIYKLYFDNDSRFYIGSTNDLQERLQAHTRAVNKQKHFNRYFQRLCLKLGIENLKYEILAKCPQEYLLKMEQWFVDKLKPELNLAEIVGRPPVNRKRGYKMSEEAKRNISKAKTGQKIDRSNYTHSEETLQKISNSLKGRVITDEWKQRMKEAKANGGKYSKLTIEQVKEIKSLVGNKTDKEIAELFSCSRATINQIKNNKIWKEV
jgi:group I intron endonuclease